MRRIIVLGTGTEIGKTFVTTRLIAALARAAPNDDVVGIKPIETGFQRGGSQRPALGSDARALEDVSRGTPLRPHPVLLFRDPISPHLAARRERAPVSIPTIASRLTLHGATLCGWQIVETAGGTFSPLSPNTTNFDLARALEPAVWILVAPDRLGVLHDVRATLLAMRAAGREPDHLVLSASEATDASVGTNGAEFARVGLPKPAAIMKRNDDGTSLAALVRSLLRRR